MKIAMTLKLKCDYEISNFIYYLWNNCNQNLFFYYKIVYLGTSKTHDILLFYPKMFKLLAHR